MGSNSGFMFTGPGSTTTGLTYTYGACPCCGGHPAAGLVTFTPAGYQGAAQHTYTPACAGFHEPGPCPEDKASAQITWSFDYIKGAYGQESSS